MLLDDVRTLTPRIRGLAARIEHDRAVPEEIIARLAELGVFRIAAPRAAGGREAAPAELFDVFEELGYADGSTGWCAMIGGATSMVLGRLDPAVATGLLADPRFLIAGVAAPAGRATEVDGGLLVDGRWRFASASKQATWLVGGVVLPGPEVRHVIMAAGELTVHDTWQVAGLCGTGSHDIEATGVFVPAERVFTLAGPYSAEHLFPPLSLLALGIGAVALGIARCAIEAFGTLARPGRPATQATVAQAEALRASGSAYLRTAVSAAGTQVADRARQRLATVTATRHAAAAVDLVYQAGGGAAVYLDSPLQRCFRDVHVATQHAMVGPDVLATAGAVLLGEDVTVSRL